MALRLAVLTDLSLFTKHQTISPPPAQGSIPRKKLPDSKLVATPFETLTAAVASVSAAARARSASIGKAKPAVNEASSTPPSSGQAKLLHAASVEARAITQPASSVDDVVSLLQQLVAAGFRYELGTDAERADLRNSVERVSSEVLTAEQLDSLVFSLGQMQVAWAKLARRIQDRLLAKLRVGWEDSSTRYDHDLRMLSAMGRMGLPISVLRADHRWLVEGVSGIFSKLSADLQDQQVKKHLASQVSSFCSTQHSTVTNFCPSCSFNGRS